VQLSSTATLDHFIRESESILEGLKLDRPPLAYVCQQEVALDRKDGLWLEFGTGSGSTARVMAKSRERGKVYTFDWFKGLPDDWLPDYGVLKGKFAQPLPTDLPDNIEIVLGRFEESLEPFLQAHPELPADLIHVDCDIYESTRYVLDRLEDRIVAGSVLVFDELLYYPGFHEHEMKALYEWLLANQRHYEWLGTHGDQSALDIVIPAATDPKLQKSHFVGINRDIIAESIPLKDRAAIRILS